MEMRDITTSVGTFTLKEPLAGPRNRAMIKAETADGFKSTIFLFELLPVCVAKRPIDVDQSVPIGQLLDSLTGPDYDLLSDALAEIMGVIGKKTGEEVMSEKKE